MFIASNNPESLITSLNEEQQQAVTTTKQYCLVLAGAGSGKTRVLVHRIAWLLSQNTCSPYDILAVTFTNKAAQEMRSRIETLTHYPVPNMWVGTFHGISHRLLRLHWKEAGLSDNFQILDSDDQLRLIKRLFKELELDDKRVTPRQAQHFINQHKDIGLRAKSLTEDNAIYYDPILATFYQAYEARCERSGLVDFAELILRTVELFRQNDELRAHYQNRFKHILIDEFQDTNGIQYDWVQLLTGKDSKLLIVGDDDQSIYGWRGAKIENIHDFTRDFSDVEVIRLERNYRSTSTILKAANAIIKHNRERLGKNLWTEQTSGEPIAIYTGFNDIDEARFITNQIKQYQDQGYNLREMAILYRSNAQSRILEDALIQARLPYRIYGGLRFFERAEIKDALAYLRICANPDDDGALERIINTPTRGIGERSLITIRQEARQQMCSLWQAAKTLAAPEDARLTTRAKTAITRFCELIGDMAASLEGLDLPEQVEAAISQSGLTEHYQKEGGEKGQARCENLGELITAAQTYEPDEEHDIPMLSQFLSHAALEAGESERAATDDYVHMMTMHSAKGLEFPVVFLSGLEESLFPHMLSLEDPRALEEERRLCYVGITRAMKHLTLTYAEKRRLRGKESYQRPSRFLLELPKECIEEVRLKSYIFRPTKSPSVASTPLPTVSHSVLQLGQRVSHAKFGTGIILNMEGQGARARVEVNFDSQGTKWLSVEHAKLQPVD